MIVKRNFNGNSIVADTDKKTVTLNNQHVFILKKYVDEMDLEAFIIVIGYHELKEDGTVIKSSINNEYRIPPPYRGEAYELYSQDWVTQLYRKMAMINNICENEIAHFIGEKVNVFLNKFLTDGVTEDIVECWPLYLVKSDEGNIFRVDNNRNLSDNITLIVGGNEYPMNVIDGTYEYDVGELDSGVYQYYVLNTTVGNKSAYKYFTIDEIEDEI